MRYFYLQSIRILFGAAACSTLLFAPLAGYAQQEELQEQVQKQLDEILVTGSYIRGLKQEDIASPVQTINRDDLLNSGAASIADIVNNLTINTGSENNPDAFTQNFTAGTSNMNLRGLGVSATLVMLNGRRQVTSAFTTDKGESFVDVSSLVPMIAVDRVEILKDGASALYGSDAVAGVANFHTRNNFEGIELSVESQSGEASSGSTNISGIYGAGNGTTHFILAASLYDRDPLGTDDRRLSRTNDDRSPAGMPGTFLFPFAPSATGLYGNPLGPFAAVPAGWAATFDTNSNGVADLFDPIFMTGPLVQNAKRPGLADPSCLALAANDSTVIPSTVPNANGQATPFPFGSCDFDFGSFYSLTPKEKRTQVFALLSHDISESLAFTLEFGLAENEAERRNSPSFPITSTPIVCGNDGANRIPGAAPGDPDPCIGLSGPTAHPDNIFQQDVLFIGRVRGSGADALITTHDSDTSRFVIGLEGEINESWFWEASYTNSKNDFLFTAKDTLANEFQNALFGFGGNNCAGRGTGGVPGSGDCLYYNPFGSALTGTGNPNSQEVLDYITGDITIDASSELTVLGGHASGELFEIGDSMASIAFGLEFKTEKLSQNWDEQSNDNNYLFFVGNPDFDKERDIKGGFIELALPLADSLNVQIALSHDDYDGIFSSTDPKVAVLWRPTDDLSIRGSIGSSFRAPSLFQQNGIQTSLVEIEAVGQFLAVRAEANPLDMLEPEEADTVNLGLSWSSENTHLSVDYWSFDYNDAIIQQDANAIVTASLPTLSVNPAACATTAPCNQIAFNGAPSPFTIQRVNVFYDNASSLKTDGVDLNFQYTLPDAAVGQLTFGASLTQVLTYDLTDPQLGKIDGLGKRNFGNFATSMPETRGNLSAIWQQGAHSFSTFMRHIGGYDDDQNMGDSIGSHNTFDLQYNYLFEPMADAADGILLTIGGINVTDEDPPHVATNGGYDSKVHDPRGKIFYVKASIPF